MTENTSDAMNSSVNSVNFDRASEFLQKNARPLEKALFEFHFSGEGSTEKVIFELAKFQNEDGGFGRALEPDLRATHSSALASSFALPILAEVNTDPNHTIVKDHSRYLLNTLDSELKRWEIITLETQESAHAPWWNGDVLMSFRGCYANPRGTILGALVNLQALPIQLNDTLISTVSYFSNESNELSMHDIICGIDLIESNINSELKSRFGERLLRETLSCVERDSKKWSEYSAWPIWFSRTPQSFASEELADLVTENLQFLAATQLEDGSWPVPWEWSNDFIDDWKRAKLEWKGILTLKYLKAFRAFGYL